jgi:hypothetical protein
VCASLVWVNVSVTVGAGGFRNGLVNHNRVEIQTARSALVGPAEALRNPFGEFWHISIFCGSGWLDFYTSGSPRHLFARPIGQVVLLRKSDLAVDRNLMVRYTAFIRV